LSRDQPLEARDFAIAIQHALFQPPDIVEQPLGGEPRRLSADEKPSSPTTAPRYSSTSGPLTRNSPLTLMGEGLIPAGEGDHSMECIATPSDALR
jgi:hypothetical protein